MNAKLKSKLLFYALIFLGVLNIATIGTIVLQVNSGKKIQQQDTTMQNDTSAQVMSNEATQSSTTYRRGRSLLFRTIVKELELNSEQYRLFVEEHRKFIAKMRSLIADLHRYRELIDLELAKDNPSMTQIRRYSRKIGKIHEQLSIVQSEYYVSLARLCTPQAKDKTYGNFIQAFTKLFWPGPWRKGFKPGQVQNLTTIIGPGLIH